MVNGTTSTTGKFVDAPIHILADHSTDVVNYKDKDIWLNTVLDSKVEAENVYTKTEADKTLSKYFVKLNDKGLYDVDITSLIFALIGAIQKLSDDISKLKN